MPKGIERCSPMTKLTEKDNLVYES